MTKHPFLVVYDYGAGGVWAVIYAEDKAQIAAKYPLLKVVDTRPVWMTEDEYRQIRDALSFDIEAEPRGWLLSVAAQQEGRR